MRVILAAVTLVALANGSANAYLGGFENTDGYIDVIPYFYGKKFDVAHYNSGQFGFNAGGGAYNNSAGAGALWKHLPGSVLQPALGAFGSETYATGHQSYDRDFVNNTGGARNDLALVITTNGDGWNLGPREYSYKLDQYDLNGNAATGPSTPTPSPTNGKIKFSYWSCAQLLGSGEGGGLIAGTIGDKISFYDSGGQLGFEVGYIQPGTTLDNAWYRAGNTGTSGAGTTIPITLGRYHRWDINLDTQSNTVEASLFDPFAGGGTTYNVIPAGTPTVANMSNLAELQFTSTAGINNEKRWSVDDFGFCITEAPLSTLLAGGTLWSGDKQFSEFEYHGGGDMPAAEDVFVKAITDAEGNVGIRFQGAFVDAFGGGASDALIDFKVTAPEGKLIKDVYLAANPLVVGGGDKAGLVSVTETFLADNDQTVLSVFDIKPGARQLTDGADLVDENGNLAPVQELHVQKDIIAWAQKLGSAATLSFIDQTFSQCDADPMNPGRCRVEMPNPLMNPAPDFNGDGVVNAADYATWRDGLGTKYSQEDYEIWRAHFGQIMGSSVLSAVPEPTAWLLLAIGMLATFPTRRMKPWPAIPLR